MRGETREIRRCEVCGNATLTPVFDLGLHPLCDDLIPVGDPRTCLEYPVDILFCETCHTAHQHFQVRKELLFPPSYHYRARVTADVLTGMANFAESCERQFGPVLGQLVLDVGCNDGSLLNFFREKGARTVGIEPTGAARDAEERGHPTYNEFLSESVARRLVDTHGNPAIVTFTNVFAHIENLDQVYAALRALQGPKTAIVIENHYLGSVLDRNQFDTFYHEHPRTYSFTSFAHIAKALGMTLAAAEFPSRYGGNIRVFLAPAGTAPMVAPQEVLEQESRFVERFRRMRDDVQTWRTSKRALLKQLAARHGKLHAKAFPARAAILFKLLDLGPETFEAIHEKPGSLKIGHYAPGTRVPIVSDDVLFASGDTTAPLINLAWHIPEEIRKYLAQQGYNAPVLDIVSAEDFRTA